MGAVQGGPVMARERPSVPHDFPDRVIRDALVHPANLRALVGRVAPEVAEKLDFERREVVNRSYLLDDWRRREADVLVRIPYRDAPGDLEVLVCILVEHQSGPDQAMPLRMLLYAVLFWEQEWKAWETRHDRGQPLRLTPVLPIVLHPGPSPWDTNRSLEELFGAPESARVWAPRWPALWWDLPEHEPADLLEAGEAWWQTLAVV